MKRLKKYICMLCLLGMLQYFFAAAEATPSFELTVTDDSPKSGDKLFMLVDLKDNRGFGALQFSVTYDKEKILLEGVSQGELIPEGAVTSVNTDISGEIIFSVISVENITGSGTVLVSEFKAKAPGKVKLDFQLMAYANSNGVSLDAAGYDVEFIIESEESGPLPDTDTGENGSGNETGGGSGYFGSSEPVEDKKEANEEKEEEKPLKPSFSDVNESYWAYNSIYKAAEMGLFSGTGENIFSPELPMTRAMFVTVLHRYAGSPEAGKADFEDLEDSWYTGAVSWAAENNIVSGTGDNKFSPHRYITRGEIATVLCRYKNGKSSDMNLINSFNDGRSIPEWGREAVAWAIEQGIITGRSGGIIAFSDNATRAEAAVIFTRFLNVR